MMNMLQKKDIIFDQHEYVGFKCIANAIYFDEDITKIYTKHLCSAIYQMIERRKYTDITLDFSKVTKPSYTPVLVAASRSIYYKSQGDISFSYVPPIDDKASKLFYNANWSHFFDAVNFPNYSLTKRGQHIPSIKFIDQKTVHNGIDIILENVLASIQLDRDNLTALEWALAELTENALTHSQTKCSSLLHAEVNANKKLVSLWLVDSGIGIPVSLRKANSGYTSDTDALADSIKEGVTSNPPYNQGNGLYGSYRMAIVSRGFFRIESNKAQLEYKLGNLNVKKSDVPFPGTLIECTVRLEDAVLGEALNFKGKKHKVSYDYVNKATQFCSTTQMPIIRIKEECASTRSRSEGESLKNKIINFSHYHEGKKVVLDFTDVSLISSSFADEAIGKIYAEFGFIDASQRLEFRNINDTIKQLIDRAILLRLQKKTTVD